MDLLRVKFEVMGIVQGVYFRAHARNYANGLGIKGWVQNTPRSTVMGEGEGPSEKINQFKHWLRYTGSPSSSIIDAKFEEEQIQNYSFQSFIIK